ncbi:MAG TPA: hypothetical protein PKX25_13435 [Microthrixaceae bacterium]|nr:hypothetical protein [Microthrixaceae bacterium]HMY87421.1 hypothetical protein [Microthrixaceae bacterium]
MKVRLEPADEYMHPGPEPTFNESMYFNLYDPDARLGGFVRIGNRPNEGHAEMTVCLYLPDGRVGFMFRRADIDSNDRFDAGGATIDVVEPFRTDVEHAEGAGGGRIDVGYHGQVVLLEEPLDMAHPRRAFTENPYADARVQLTYEGISRPFGGEPEERHERPGEEFAKGHYEQLVRGTGTIAVGDSTWSVAGLGLRDHSWGPRTWQAPWYYRWLTMNFSDGTGLMLSRIARPDSRGTRSGFVWDGRELHLVGDVTLRTEWVGDDSHHSRIHATFSTVRLGTDEITPGIERTVTGDVLNLIPLRNRRDERVTRISEGLTRWELDRALGDDPTATVGHGLSEYLDQIVDGNPVGLDE